MWLLSQPGVLAAVGGAVSPLLVAYIMAAVVDLLLAVVVLSKREKAGSRPLALFLVAVALGAISQGLATSVTTLEAKLIVFQLGLVGTALVPIGWIYFGIEYAGDESWTGRRTLVALSIEPVLFLCLLVLPVDRAGLFWTVVNPDAASFGEQIDFGVAVVIHFAYYFLGLVFGSLLFLRLFVRARHLYRGQAAALLFGALIPWVGHTLSLTELFADVRLLPFLLTLSGGAMTLALFRFKLLDPVPVAQETVFEDMGDGVVILDGDDCVGKANPAAKQLLSPNGELRGTAIETVLPSFDTLSETGTREDWHELSLDVEGETRHVEIQISPYYDRNGSFVGRLLLLRDITARKQREQLLARYKTIFESVRDRVLVLDENDDVMLVNEPMSEFVERSQAELEGAPFETILADQRSDGGQSRRLLDAEPGEIAEVTVETAAGERIPCETMLAPIEFDDERTGVVGVLRDISRHKRTERHLAETSERLETLVSASPLAIIGTDAEGQVEVWNPAAESTFGWTAEEAIGSRPPCVPDDAVDRMWEIHQRVIDGDRLTGLQIELGRRDGTRIDASVSVAPIANVDGKIRGTVAVIADVTEQKERERKLREQNERLEQFTSIVSHDLRNPMQVAMGHLDLVESGDDASIDTVRTSLDRMDELIDTLLTLAREGQAVDPGDLEPLGLEAVARAAWETVETKDATLETEAELGELRADRTRLQELLENLYRNAVEHAGTDVTVTIGQIDDDDTADGGGFYVADDGPGIPAEQREEVFDSGYTTSSDGTGLGLSIVTDFAEAHGWTVELTESSHGGVRFEIRGVERP